MVEILDHVSCWLNLQRNFDFKHDPLKINSPVAIPWFMEPTVKLKLKFHGGFPIHGLSIDK